MEGAIITFYLLGVLFTCFVGSTTWNIEGDKRSGARMILLSPLWPIYFAYLMPKVAFGKEK